MVQGGGRATKNEGRRGVAHVGFELLEFDQSNRKLIFPREVTHTSRPSCHHSPKYIKNLSQEN